MHLGGIGQQTMMMRTTTTTATTTMMMMIQIVRQRSKIDDLSSKRKRDHAKPRCPHPNHANLCRVQTCYSNGVCKKSGGYLTTANSNTNLERNATGRIVACKLQSRSYPTKNEPNDICQLVLLVKAHQDFLKHHPIPNGHSNTPRLIPNSSSR